MRLNLPAIEEELVRDKGKPARELVWLEESCRAPAAFWHSLKTVQDAFSPLTGKSIPLKQYDFYHDLITRNLRLTTPALRWYDPVSGWQEISYGELGAAAGRKAAVWTQLQVKSGDVLCIIYPLGIKYAVSLLAAFKTGLTVSFLLPQGSGFLQKRLEALNPDYIITEEIFSSLLPGWQDRLLPENGPVSSGMDAANSASFDRSHTYLAGEVIALCFDPSSRTPHIPKELTADAAYLCPLRDGMIALGLRPGHMVAGLGLHFLEACPALLLASLLNGGTYLHLEPEHIAANPKLLAAYPARAIVISQKVRDILLRNPVEIGNLWASWFRNPAESFDPEEWQSFIQALKLEDSFAGNMKWEAAMGGCSLFSVKQKGRVHSNVLPSAGVPWCLTGLSGSGVEVLGGCGLFSPALIGAQEGENAAGVSILTRGRKEWLFAGSLLSDTGADGAATSILSGRAGRTYPRLEILETLRDLPFCSDCSIACAPFSGAVGDPLFVLLIFTGGKTGVDEAEICTRIRNKIEREMGREFLPDRIQFFPLFPRYDQDGNIDHNWCQRQYLNSDLSRKSRQEIYRCLTRLRDLVREARNWYRSTGK